MQIVEGAIVVTALLSIGFFLLYLIGSLRLPTGKRPKTPTFDRLGRPLPAQENPGFKETEDEEER
ncbi:MAG TPA: hypothetical protein VF898_11640 [Chloroflexota bacterium]